MLRVKTNPRFRVFVIQTKCSPVFIYYQCPSTNLFSTACVTSTQSFRRQL